MTGKTSQRVMNLMSSIAVTLLGSAMATVSVRPSRFRGSTVCLVAMSGGMSFRIFASTSNRDRSTAGMRYCRASIFLSCSWVIRPSRNRISPSLSWAAAAVAVCNSLKLRGLTCVLGQSRSRLDDEWPYCVQQFDTHTWHAVETTECAKWTVLGAPGDDPLCQRRTDSRQSCDFAHVGEIEVDALAGQQRARELGGAARGLAQRILTRSRGRLQLHVTRRGVRGRREEVANASAG